MNQIWLVLTQEGVHRDRVVLNIMTSSQKNDMTLASRGQNIITQFKVGCDDIRVHNINMNPKGASAGANWFDRIMLAGDIFEATEKGSLIHIRKEGEVCQEEQKKE